MSNDIRRYAPDTDWLPEAEPLKVTASVGDPRLDLREDDPDERLGHGRSAQLQINGEYTILTEKQVLDLIAVLSRRVACADGFSGTDTADLYTVQPDGTKEVTERW